MSDRLTRRSDRRSRRTPTDPYIKPRRSHRSSTNHPVPAGSNRQTSPPDVAAMSFYSPSTSFYPCPIRAADVFKPQPPPPPTYYLTDHVRIEYNDNDWGEEEASAGEELNGSHHTTAAGHASMMVRARLPLGLLSVKMREQREQEKIGSGGSKDDEILKEVLFATPGMRSVPFPHIVLMFVAEQSAPALKAYIPQGPPSAMRSSKVIAESNVKPRARKPLVSANARKKSKAASKPNRRRVQVVLTQATEEKENLPHVSSDSDDEIDDPLVHSRPTQKTPNKRQGHWAAIMDALPDPFVLTSSDECDDPLEA